MSKFIHNPVMLNEIIECLKVKPNGWYIDATFGRGGHTQAILDKLGPQGKLIAIDKDLDAIAYARQKYAHDARFQIYHACFSDIPKLLGNNAGKIDGILVDLGVSSAQLDDPSRGFSFRYEAKLDMRMDQSQKITAAEWLENATSKEISTVLKKYGEEVDAHRIAEKIIAARAVQPIETTKHLSDLISQVKVRYHKKKIHPATLSFQAIRIHVNKELDALNQLLSDAPNLLKKEGILAVMSFHSLEDRMVKRSFRKLVTPNLPKKLPIMEKAIQRPFDWHLKRAMPSSNECEINPRARSAVLRAIRKG
ncbi:MAG: 16S rRNA (cytosine(1402)-N(4))-methyltransferase RsmH [Candidatus Berkiella sp.]